MRHYDQEQIIIDKLLATMMIFSDPQPLCYNPLISDIVNGKNSRELSIMKSEARFRLSKAGISY